MPDIPRIFEELPNRLRRETIRAPQTYYFSVGGHKFTVRVAPDGCTVEPGQTVDKADVVLKTTPELFEKMVIRGKLPGPMDIAMGRVKTNDPLALKRLRESFDLSGL